MVIPFGTAVNAFVGFTGAEEEEGVAYDCSDDDTITLPDGYVLVREGVDHDFLSPVDSAAATVLLGDDNDDADSILPVLDYESEGSIYSASSGSPTPTAIYTIGTSAAGAGQQQQPQVQQPPQGVVNPLDTPITPENVAEQARKLNELRAQMQRQQDNIRHKEDEIRTQRTTLSALTSYRKDRRSRLPTDGPFGPSRQLNDDFAREAEARDRESERARQAANDHPRDPMPPPATWDIEAPAASTRQNGLPDDDLRHFATPMDCVVAAASLFKKVRVKDNVACATGMKLIDKAMELQENMSASTGKLHSKSHISERAVSSHPSRRNQRSPDRGQAAPRSRARDDPVISSNAARRNCSPRARSPRNRSP